MTWWGTVACRPQPRTAHWPLQWVVMAAHWVGVAVRRVVAASRVAPRASVSRTVRPAWHSGGVEGGVVQAPAGGGAGGEGAGSAGEAAVGDGDNDAAGGAGLAQDGRDDTRRGPGRGRLRPGVRVRRGAGAGVVTVAGLLVGGRRDGVAQVLDEGVVELAAGGAAAGHGDGSGGCAATVVVTGGTAGRCGARRVRAEGQLLVGGREVGFAVVLRRAGGRGRW